MGSFELEEGVKNMLIALGSDCQFNYDELQEFNPNMENVIRANNVNRGQNNIISQSAQGVAAQQPGMAQQQQPGGAMGMGMGH